MDPPDTRGAARPDRGRSGDDAKPASSQGMAGALAATSNARPGRSRHARPTKPRFNIPTGACDCHVHMFDPVVSVTLVNDLAEPVSIVFPGQTGVQAGGVPAQPQLSGSEVTSLVQPAPVAGSMTYTFTASEPGTYIYESGTDPVKQVQMGLYGALVIRPAGHADWSYNDVATKFKADTEYVMLLSEVDPDLHQAIERGLAYDFTTLHPRYWMINGRSFPDTIAPNGAAWLPTQPYSSMVHIQPFNASTNPDPALIRYLNVGSLNHPFHPHGNHGRVIARDGRLLEGAGGEDLSYEKFTVLVGAGQTWDSTFKFTRRGALEPGDQPDPGRDPAAAEPDVQGQGDLVQREPVPGGPGRAADRRDLVQPVRRVLPRRP